MTKKNVVGDIVDCGADCKKRPGLLVHLEGQESPIAAGHGSYAQEGWPVRTDHDGTSTHSIPGDGTHGRHRDARKGGRLSPNQRPAAELEKKNVRSTLMK